MPVHTETPRAALRAGSAERSGGDWTPTTRAEQRYHNSIDTRRVYLHHARCFINTFQKATCERVGCLFTLYDVNQTKLVPNVDEPVQGNMACQDLARHYRQFLCTRGLGQTVSPVFVHEDRGQDTVGPGDISLVVPAAVVYAPAGRQSAKPAGRQERLSTAWCPGACSRRLHVK